MKPSLPGIEKDPIEWPDEEVVRTKGGALYRLRNVLVTDENALADMVSQLEKEHEIAYDSETSGLQPHLGARICGHSLARFTGKQEVTAWYVPVRHLNTMDSQIDPKVAANAVQWVMNHSGGEVDGHHFKFDQSMLRADGVRVFRRSRDTAIEATIHDENEESFGLKQLGGKYVYAAAATEEKRLKDWMRKDAKSLKMKFKDRKKGSSEPSYLEKYGYARTPIKMCGLYACKDVFLTLMLRLRFRKVVEQFSDLYTEELGVAHYLHEMEWNGLPVDVEQIRRSSEMIQEEVAYWKSEVERLSGIKGFDPKDSNIRWLFYQQLKMDPPKETESGLPAVDKEARTLLAGKYAEHRPLIKALDALSKSDKIRSTYSEKFFKYVTPYQTIHPSYNQLEEREEGGVPVTGRLGSSEPNIQNQAKKPIHLHTCACSKCADEKHIPEGEKKTISVRRYFIVPKGYVYAYIDFSQIELRVLAWLSQDPVLLHCYQNGVDVHTVTANEVTAGDRDIAKQINFGNSYGMTKYGLAQRLPHYGEDPDRALADAEAYLEKFFETYAGIPRFRNRLAKKMRANNDMFVNPFGRPRRIPMISSDEGYERARAERMMMSSIVSGTAADLMKHTMLRCGQVLASNDNVGSIIQSIHDEIVFKLPINHLSQMLPQLMHQFTNWPMFSDPSDRQGVPIEASCELSVTTWEDKREIKLLDDGSFRWAA